MPGAATPTPVPPTATPGAADGYAGAADGYAGAADDFDGARDGYGRAGHGYAGSNVGYANAENGYANSDNGYADARNGYSRADDGYDSQAAAYAGDADGYDWSGNGYDGTEHGYAEATDGYGGGAYLGPGSYVEPGAVMQDRRARTDDPMLTAPDAGIHPDRWQAEQELRREAGRRGPMVGAVTEFLATGVVIGVSTLAAALLTSAPSPVSAMGAVFIERTPAALRNAVIHQFGAQGRIVLLLGMYVTFAVVAIVIGMMARRDAAACVGRRGGVHPVRRVRRDHQAGQPRDRRRARGHRRPGRCRGGAVAVPRVRAARASWGAPARARWHPEEDTMTGTVDRRKFLRAAGITAVGAAAAGVGGERLLGRQFRQAPPVSMAPAGPSTAPPPELKIDPMTPLRADETLDNIAGLSPFYTPNNKFYRVDTSLVLPKVSPGDWQLRIHGMVDRPMTLTYDDLIHLPMIDRDITLTCVSEAVGGNFIGNARWQGTLLAPILRKAGIQRGADQIVMRDVHGMTIGVATDPTMDGRDSMLAVAMNGQVLPQAHGYPVRVVIPGLYGYVSATKWVVDMEFTTFGAFSAYWVKQTPAWSQQAPIKNRVPHRRAEEAQHRDRGPGDDRRGGLGPAHRHRGRRGGHQRRLLPGEAPGPGRHRHLAAVVLRLGRDSRAAHAPGAGHRQKRLHADRDQAQDRAERRDRLSHHHRERDLSRLADGAHPLCAPSA